tara:strand:+ start:460 stop:615 length:156 start_codon:yes stop_codon:yes gene_type:complete
MVGFARHISNLYGVIEMLEAQCDFMDDHDKDIVFEYIDSIRVVIGTIREED